MSRKVTRGRTRRGPRPGSRDARGRSRAQLIVASIVAVVAVAALVWIGNSAGQAPAASAPPVTQSGHVRGQATAPVTIEEWADFQCPACGAFARGTEPQLVSTYVASGQVRLVFRHFAFLGNESQWAAEAAECADEQGRFWEFHDKLYASQAGENRGAFSRDNLKKMGGALSLGPTFGACVDSGRYAQRVRSDMTAGEAKGVQATPTLFANGRKIEGAVSFEQLKAIIDPLLPSSR